MYAPAWLDELDLHVGAPEAAMSTRRLDVDAWFLLDDEWDAQRSQARTLLATRRDDVVAGLAPDAAAALDGEIVTWLTDHGADSSAIADDDPLVEARSRVADDLCLLVRTADGWRLAAGVVCFPSLWRVHDKVHHPLVAVHEPVPGYAGPLASRVDAFLDRSAPRGGAWRRNWSIHADDELFVPDHASSAVLPPPEARILRSERQTLRRVRELDAIAFTIRTQQVRLSSLRARPDVCASLAAAIGGWTPAQRAYKGHAVDDALLRWLDAV